MKFLGISLLLYFGMGVLGAEGVVKYRDVQAVFNKRCIRCHNPYMKEGGLSLTSYKEMLDNELSGDVVSAGSVEDSILMDGVLEGDMPPQEKMPANEINTIASWIVAGAEDDKSDHLDFKLMMEKFRQKCNKCHTQGKTYTISKFSGIGREHVVKSMHSMPGSGINPDELKQMLVFAQAYDCANCHH